MATAASGPRIVSYSLTFVGKFVFPILWVGAFAATTVSKFLSPQSGHRAGKWVFLAITLVGAGFFRLVTWPVKRVRMDDHALYISDYFTEIAVPLSRVAEVTWDFSRSCAVIRFVGETVFGSQVVFIPRRPGYGIWTTYWETFDAIKEAVKLAKENGTDSGVPS